MSVTSPITGSENVRYIGSIKVTEIIEKYRKNQVDIDPTYLFDGLSKVDIYECNDSAYRFYWPLHITGDDKYYSELGKLDWYYLPWKWEHEAAAAHIKKGDKVLEVGAAKGDFLKKLKNTKGAEVTGLELNSDADEYSALNKVKIINQSIEDHAKETANHYDVVCTFQVLEHIAHVKSFIQAMVTALKPGGTLIISVPNNDSFIKDNRLINNVYNQPPHHLGLWTEKSLKNLENYFDLKYQGKDLEPLQAQHEETYVINRFYKYVKSDFLVKVLWKLGITKLFKSRMIRNRDKIIGHSINVYFTKK